MKDQDSPSSSAARLPNEEQRPPFVPQDLRRNYLAYLGHGLLGQTGMRLLNAPTFVPAYVFALSGSDFVVGLARGLQYLGMCISPVWSATLVEHRARVRPLAFRVGGAMRLQILGLAAAGFFLSAPFDLVAVLVFLGLFGFFLGMQGVIFSALLVKVIPVERRGILVGLRNTLSGVMAAGVAYLAGEYLIGEKVLGDGFSKTFGLAFLLTSIGLLMLLFLREPRSQRLRPRTGVRERLLDLPGLLRSDRAFTFYFLSRALATMGRMALPFYFLYAHRRMDADYGEALAILSTAFLLAQTLSNLGWGLMADRGGFRGVFIASLGIGSLAVILLMVTEGMMATSVAFAGIGAGVGGFMLSSQNMVLEFGTHEELPMRVAVANSASEFMGAVGPLVGGLIVSLSSYTALFWTAIGFQTAAALVVLAFVDEPRQRGSG